MGDLPTSSADEDSSGGADEDPESEQGGDNENPDVDENADGDVKAHLSSLTPQALDNLVNSIRSHDLFPRFEQDQVGCSEFHPDKIGFGAKPVADILRWNSWLDYRRVHEPW